MNKSIVLSEFAYDSKKKNQQNLNKLYTGTEIKSEKIYAENFTYILCVLFYSTGCPLLYPMGAVFFTIQYWYQKTLQLRFHRRSDKLSEKLPVGSLEVLKVAIILHIGMAYVLLSDDGLLPGAQTVLEYDNKLTGWYQFRRLRSFLLENFEKSHTRLYAFTAVCIFLVYVLQSFFGKFLIRCCTKCRSLCVKNDKK